MEFSIKAGSPEKQKAGCVVAGVFEPRRLSDAAKALDRAAKGRISCDLAPGRPGRKARLHALAARSSRRRGRARVCCVGLGKEDDFGPKAVPRGGARGGARARAKAGPRMRCCTWPSYRSRDSDAAWKAMHLASVAGDASYRFDQLKSKKDSKRRQAEARPRRDREAVCRRRARARARHGAGGGHEPREGSGQSAQQHLHAELSRTTGAGTGQGLQAQVPGAGREGHGEAGHGRAAVCHEGLARAGQAGGTAVSGRREEEQAGRAGRQRHHLRHRRHLAQTRSRDGRDEVRHVRRRQRTGHDQSGGADGSSDQCRGHHSDVREHARRKCDQARRHRHQHVRPDHRDSQYRRRRPADPVRCADLCGALRSGGSRGHRDPDRRLRDRAGACRLRSVRQ